MENNKYDSTEDTNKHIQLVQEYMDLCIFWLNNMAYNHDRTKLEEPEKEYFDTYTPLLKDVTYGSDKYKEYLKEIKVALDHHYKHNSHHTEHYEQGIKGMGLLNLLEMICDWIAATKRHNDGDILKSIEINQERFGYTDELKQIFINTVEKIV